MTTLAFLMWATDAAADAVEPAPGASLMELVLPMLAVVFALAALWWAVRRQGGRGASAGPARIVQVLAVGPRERVLIVDHDTQRFMLGVTPTTINLLARLDGKDAAKNRASASLSAEEEAQERTVNDDRT